MRSDCLWEPPIAAAGSSRRTQGDDMATQPESAAARDILALIHDDHQNIDRLFASYAASQARKEKRRIIEAIYLELLPHAQAEEEIFYPSIADAGDGEHPVDEAFAEHAAARKTIESIMAASLDDPTYDMKVKMLQKAVQHHVREEETELFEEARECGADLEALADRFVARKAELRAEVAAHLRDRESN